MSPSLTGPLTLRTMDRAAAPRNAETAAANAQIIRDGVASFGYRPTVTENGDPWLETFVFDFSGDLYGEICSVSFFGHLRDEWKFDGLDPLVAQIRKDEEEARALLAGVQPLGELDAKIAF